ncbi:hypothetical protein Syun_001024 [Stephania yunnanensis]|uniref:Uncharacterized protein n=1 Tax=Stephania yunnanensis TaxID=152371 RepID=A0AAP0LH20_9MAGN
MRQRSVGSIIINFKLFRGNTLMANGDEEHRLICNFLLQYSIKPHVRLLYCNEEVVMVVETINVVTEVVEKVAKGVEENF